MNQSMSKSISLILLSSLSFFTAASLTAETIMSNQAAQGNQFSNNQQNDMSKPIQIKWLGISLGQISPALQSQLATQLKEGMGVMITGVQANSPAEKAGLKAFDILTRFNKTTVSNTQQVYDLVQQSSTGDEIKLEYIRAGKKQVTNAQIGSREINHQQNWSQPFRSWPNGNRLGGWPNVNNDPFWNSQPRWNQPFFQNFDRNFSAPFDNFPNMPRVPDFSKDFGKNLSGKKAQRFSQSESLSMETLKDGKIHIELKSKDTDNNEKNFIFEGKREQIIKDIQQQKDLPEAQKQNLTGAIQGNFSSLYNDFNFNSSNGSFSQPPLQPLPPTLEQQKAPKRLNY